MYLLDVYRRKLEFPDLKRAVRELAKLHDATVVLIEDKASGTSLIQELRADNFYLAQPAPNIDGDKSTRLRSQTAKIEGGFVLFPESEHWLANYILELVTFPNAPNDDQVDSTVYALYWHTQNATEPAILTYMKNEVAKIAGNTYEQNKKNRVWIPSGPSHWGLIDGNTIFIPPNRIIEVSEEDVVPILRAGGKRAD